MKDFTNGDNLTFLTTFRDQVTGELIDPSSTWGRVYDSSSTVVATIAAMTKVTTGDHAGSYICDWQSDPGSNAPGQGAFEAYGVSGSKVYKRREILFQLV